VVISGRGARLMIVTTLLLFVTLGGGAQTSDILVVALQGEPASLDVHQLFDPRSWMVAKALYGESIEWGRWTDPETGLVYATPDWRPGLLESWERRMEGGEIVYTCHIRKGLKFFPSGNELTAEDYKYRIARVFALSPWDITIGGITKGADAVKILDPYTFEIHIDQPNCISDRWMQEYTMMIVDSKELKKHATDEDPWAHEYLRTHALNVGPYNLDHWTPGVEIVLVKNSDYPVPEYMQGHFEKIVFKIIPSVSNQLLLLKQGQIDIAPELPKKEVLDLKGTPGIKVLSFPSVNQFYLGFNVHEKPFDDPKVRQALAYAVPYEKIVDVVFLGQAQKPTTGLIPVGTNGATDKYWVYHYDLEKAKQLLSEAGYPNGFSMDLYYDYTRSRHESAALLLKDSFGRIGINVNLVKEDPATFSEKLYAKKAPPAFLQEMISWTNDVGYTFDMCYSSRGFANFGDWVNPEAEEIHKRAWTILDPQVRLPMYDRVQEILCTELPVIPLCQPNYTLAMRDDIGGFVKYWDELPHFNLLYRIRESD